MAAAAEERVEEEESDCDYVGGKITVFVEKLCGAIATGMQEKEEEEEEEEEEEVDGGGGGAAAGAAAAAEQEQEQELEGVEEAWRDRGGLLLFCFITAKWV